jgi:hypothetical protein
MLTLRIYSTGTTPIYDSSGELLDGRDLWFETFNKGGLFGAGGIFIPRDPSKWWEVKGTLRVAIYSGLSIVYEGKIDHLADRLTESDNGVYISMMGSWGYDLMNRQWRKVWADVRTTDDAWEWLTTATGADKCTGDNRSRLRFLPKSEAWADGNYAARTYSMPFDTIARIKYTYLLDEGGQVWEVSLWRSPDNITYTQMTNASGETYNTGTTTVIVADGTAAIDVEPAAGTKYLQFRFYSRAAQTPTSDGAIFANLTGITVYSEDEGAGDIRLYSVAQDATVDFPTLLNADITKLTEMGTIRKVEPYMTGNDGSYGSIADTLYGICQFGDGTDAAWTVGLLASDKATTPNGLPVIYTAAIPLTTAGAYEYIVDLADDRVETAPEIKRQYDAPFFNNALVSFRDVDGRENWLTYTDAAGLRDATSITDYGQRDVVINLGNSTATDAANYGTRFIAQHKDPPWIISGDLVVAGTVDGANGRSFPACEVNAYCSRLYIPGYDTFVVSRTRYDYESDTVSFTFGQLEDPLFAETIFPETWDDEIGDGGNNAAGGGGSNQSWWKILDEIGPRGREKMKREGTWEAYKKAGMQKYRDLRKRRHGG